MRSGLTKKTAIVLTVLAVLTVSTVVYVLSSRYLTEQFRTRVQPRLEAYTGLQIRLEAVAVYPFPFFIEARGLSISDSTGASVLSADKIRAYLDPMALISRREVLLDYFWVRGARLEGEISSLGMIISSLEGLQPSIDDKDDQGEPVAFGFDIRRVLLEELAIDLRDSSSGIALISESIRIAGNEGTPYLVEIEAGDVIVRHRVRHRARRDSLEVPAHLSVRLALWPDHNVDLQALNIQALGSNLDMQGEIRKNRSFFNLNANIFMESINRTFGLKGPDSGSVSVAGSLETHGLSSKKTSSALAIDLEVSGDGYVESLFESLGILPIVQGYVSGSAHVYGPAGSIEVDGELELEDGKILSMDEADLKTHFHYAGSTLNFSAGRGGIIGGTAEKIDVGLTFGKKHVDYTVKCQVSDVDSIRLFRMIGWTPPHSQGGISGYVDIEGAGGDNSFIKLAGWADYKSSGIGDALYEKVTRATVGFALDRGMLVLDPVTLFAPSAEAKVVGRIDLGRHCLALDFAAWGDDIAELAGGYYRDLNGGFRLDGRVDGPFLRPLVAGHASLSRGSVAGVEFDSMEGDIHLVEGRLSVDHAVLRTGDAMIDGSGTVSLSGDGMFDFDDPQFQLGADIRRLDPNLALTLFGLKNDIFDSSTISGKLGLAGNSDTVRLELQVNSEDGNIYGQSYDRVDLDLSLENNEIKIRGFEARRNRSVLRAYGTMMGVVGERLGGYCLNFTDSDIHLDDVEILPDGLSGRVTLNTECSKTRRKNEKKIEGTGIIGMQALSYRGIDLGEGELRLRLVNDRLSFEGTVIDGLCRLEGWTLLSGNPVWSINALFERSDYGRMIVPFLGEKSPSDEISLAAGGLVTAQYLGKDLEVHARLEGLSLKAYNAVFEAEEPVVLALDGRSLRFESFSLKRGESRFEIKGGMILGRKYDLSMAGSLNLALVGELFQGFTNLRGEGRVDLDISGQWNDPEVKGSLYVYGVSLSLKDMPGRLSGMTGTLFLKDKRLSVQSFSGKWGGGRLEMNGTSTLERFALSDFHFEVKASNVSLRPMKDLSVLFDGQLYLDGREGRKLIHGNVLFQKAVYRGRIDYRTWLIKARRKEAVPPEKTWFGEAELNLHITGQDRIRVENNIARARFKADLYLMGTVAKPGLVGRLEADGGKVFFRSHEFDILTGSADFIDPHRFNPALNISAETRVQGYMLRLDLDGPMDQFNMTFYADNPDLSETDILALLTVGSTGENLEGLGENIGAAEAALFLSGGLQDTIEESVINLTGFDRFQLDPHVNKTLGTMGSRITVGKQLFSERLFVTYSADIGTTEGQSVQMEYHLIKGVSLIGQRDETGNTAADIRVHFNFD